MAYTKQWIETERWVQKYMAGSNSYVQYNLPTYAQSRTGESVPDYQQKIRDGRNATSPFTSDRTSVRVVNPGYIDMTRRQVVSGKLGTTTYRSVYSGIPVAGITGAFGTGGLSPLATATNEAEAIALTKTLKKVQSELQHMNSPAILAEIFDVIRQFGSPMRSIVSLTDRHLNKLYLAKKGLSGSTSFKRIKWSQIVADTYLEWSFGLSPLISDTKSVAEAIARLHLETEGIRNLRTRIMSRGESKSATNQSAIYRVQYGDPHYNVHVYKETVCRVQYVCGLEVSPDLRLLGSNDRLLQLLGFDHANWIPAIWEAVPWSWLIDYFTNVQEILQACATNTSGVKWISKTVSYKTVRKTSFIWNQAATQAWMNPALWKIISWAGEFPSTPENPSVEEVRTTVTRTSPATLGVPPLVIEHPFDNLKKTLNMAAVLATSRREASHALWLF